MGGRRGLYDGGFMLDELAVTDLGVIAKARLELRGHMTALTGETGAGKTLLLGALELLSGCLLYTSPSPRD